MAYELFTFVDVYQHSSLLFSDLPGVMVTPLTNVPLIFIDTAGCNMTELDTPEEESKGNEGAYQRSANMLKNCHVIVYVLHTDACTLSVQALLDPGCIHQ